MQGYNYQLPFTARVWNFHTSPVPAGSGSNNFQLEAFLSTDGSNKDSSATIIENDSSPFAASIVADGFVTLSGLRK